jgi:hypothetical protein
MMVIIDLDRHINRAVSNYRAIVCTLANVLPVIQLIPLFPLPTDLREHLTPQPDGLLEDAFTG